jgi:hypothetical protein
MWKAGAAPPSTKGTTMSEQHPLASPGAWVVLRDPRELRSGDKKAVLRSVTDTENKMAAGLDMADGLMAMLVMNWQLPSQLPLPSQDPKVLDMLEIVDYDALTELIKPAQELLFPGNPDIEKASPEEQAAAVADPASPTTPTEGWSQPSTVGQFPEITQ